MTNFDIIKNYWIAETVEIRRNPNPDPYDPHLGFTFAEDNSYPILKFHISAIIHNEGRITIRGICSDVGLIQLNCAVDYFLSLNLKEYK